MPISGFPEWLPEVRLVEESLIGTIRDIYLSHGFCSIETPAVELLSTLEANGIEGKEIYVLRRAQSDEDDTEARLALHFDLTVPFARYVSEHLNDLVFPLKRFSLQKVWRGERPQRGRSREFYQFDIDIVAREHLPVACDAEIVTVIEKAFRTLDLARYTVKINNRKLLFGCYEELGLDEKQRQSAITIVDKLDKIGAEKVAQELASELGLAEDVTKRILEISTIRVSPDDAEGAFTSLGVENETFKLGVEETLEVLRLLPAEARESIVIDLSLARGLGYYTGTILEVVFPDYPQFGSAAGGGRYENLTERFVSQKLPAVGASIGISRLMSFVLEEKLRPIGSKSPSQALIAVNNEAQRPLCNVLADELRACGVRCEVFFKSPKLGKQIDFAAKKGMPFVIFPGEDGAPHQVKNLETRDQQEVVDGKAIASLILGKG